MSSTTATKTPTTPAAHVKTRFLIISDTHSSDPNQNAQDDAPFCPPLPKADVLLHCGDLTMIGHIDEYKRTLDMLESIDADLKLVIAGNHDISLDETYYQRKGAYMQGKRYDADMPRQARELWTGARAKKAGVTYLDEGTYSFTLKNGARLGVYASPYQPEFCDYAFPYQRNEDRYNPPHHCTPGATPIAENPVPDWQQSGGIDVVMTHGPPMYVLDVVQNGDHAGCQHLLGAMQRCRPKLHCFGHIHEGWGAERVRWRNGTEIQPTGRACFGITTPAEVDQQQMREERAVHVDITRGGDLSVEFGRETLMVNASIMSLTYKPVQGPWLVDMDLERGSGP